MNTKKGAGAEITFIAMDIFLHLLSQKHY